MSTCNPENHEKHLCRLYGSGLHKDDPGRYAHLVNDPKFVCKSCGRVAAAKENLCAPIPLGTWEE
ncbi:MAG: hypothetical protein H8E62_02545 [Planctomycetes bacterium]|nr:hypothetical protein [Planctomycetota bacterium]